MTDSIDSVVSALAKVIDPEIRLPITDLGMVGQIDLTAAILKVEIKLTVAHCPMREEIAEQVSSCLALAFPGKQIKVDFTVMNKDELSELKVKTSRWN